jgi:16S rRNA (guanine527-N7)-methyltransferase
VIRSGARSALWSGTVVPGHRLVSPVPAAAAFATPPSTGSIPITQESAQIARDLIERGLRELELAASAAQHDSLVKLSVMLAAWSQRMNLTAHRSLEEIVGRLVLGAAALSVQIPAVSSIADIGSGAGFPGLPLAILRPGCRVTLIEARRRRHHFQRAVVRELGLAQVVPRLGRSEELPPEPHAAVVAQALARPSTALAWMLPWAEPGGVLLIPGSRSESESPSHPEITHSQRVGYQIPCGGPEHSVWIGRRAGD